MAIYIQKIHTEWTKKSRGNPAATLRNKIPTKLSIQKPEMIDAVFLQEYRFYGPSFISPIIKPIRILNNNQIREAGFLFSDENKNLHIELWQENRKRRNVGNLPFNNWGQLKTNNRQAWEATWAYEKNVYNIFYGDIHRLEDVMNTKPKVFEQDFQSLLR